MSQAGSEAGLAIKVGDLVLTDDWDIILVEAVDAGSCEVVGMCVHSSSVPYSLGGVDTYDCENLLAVLWRH